MNLDNGVNDDLDEKIWTKILIQVIENNMNDEDAERMYDDLTGLEMDPGEVRKARHEEMEFVKGLRVYEEAPVEECWERTGKAPIGTR